jgi:hypothetical protein
MAIMSISRFPDSPEMVLASKHLSDSAEMQPLRARVALDAVDIEFPIAFIVMHFDCHQHDAWRSK